MNVRRASWIDACVIPITLVISGGSTIFAQAVNPNVGTWKLNASKSTFSTGTALKNATVTIATLGAGVKYIVDTMSANGTARHYEYTANYDGKDSPVVGNSPYGELVALTRVDTRTVRIVSKINGKAASTQTSVLSNDGKMRSVTTKGTNVLGQTVDNVTVWDKQ